MKVRDPEVFLSDGPRDGPGNLPGLAQPIGQRGWNVGRTSPPLGLCGPSPGLP